MELVGLILPFSLNLKSIHAPGNLYKNQTENFQSV